MMKGSNLFRLLIDKVISFGKRFVFIRKFLNNRMEGWYSPHRISLAATLGVVLIWLFMLMITPAHGLADDGSLGGTLNRSGLSYPQTDTDDIYNNYFVRTYIIRSGYNRTAHKIINSQDVIISSAIVLDEMVHKDNVFDIRFLALIYGFLYFIAIYRLIKSICMRLYYFSEAVVIAVLAVIIFGDISYLAYFNSLYPEALWLICFVYLVGAINSLQYQKNNYLNLIVIAFSGVTLCFSRQHCGYIAFILSAFFLRISFFSRQAVWKGLCYIFTFLISVVGVASIYLLDTDFSLTSKYHSMTQGVLIQASDPEEVLNEFGINPSYSCLTGTSAYDYYPLVLPDNEQLKEEFFDHYNSLEITIYYLKHPGSLFRMLDLAMKDTIDLRRDFCGNFEKEAGMPKMAQSIMWSFWSFLKKRSMPGTLGFFVLLIVLSYLLHGRKSRRVSLKKKNCDPGIMLMLVQIVAAIGLSQAVISIIMSGGAEFDRHAFLMGAAMDLIIFILITEALPEMDIIEDKGEFDERNKYKGN